MDAANGNVRLMPASQCIDAGDGTSATTVVPLDVIDVDEDGNTTERMPDADLNPRVLNGRSTSCTQRIDIGAYEFNLCPSDLNGDGLTDGADLGIVLADWGSCQSCAAEINGDGLVDGADLGLVLAGWGACSNPCGGQSMMAAGLALEDAAAMLTPSTAADLLGFNSVEEMSAWLVSLDHGDMIAQLAQLFGP